MAFMEAATYYDIGPGVPLAEDYRAIRWMQDEIQGSPVIVEASPPEYRWGSRFTIYTGLPGVLGWNNHQRQQRVGAGDVQVWERYHDITSFYLTRSIDEARAFLEQYDVRYVVVGMLERMYYETFSPCTPRVDGSSVMCDMSGRLLLRDCAGFCPVDTPPQECTPINLQAETVSLSCPSHGLDKFGPMVEEGILREAYRDGGTVIYEVMP
jgi:hypothetical protein